jgi:asparagine synthase (glutamine-hydrolysing)
MSCTCGRHVLLYNGEVYNYVELRAELGALGRTFRSGSDTEVVLQALCQWGPAALDRFNGMWAIAWLDHTAGRVLFARDRFGVKPLYLYRTARSVYFASELNAILAASGERFRLNLPIVARYLRQSLVDTSTQSFFAGIEPLLAAHTLELDLQTGLDVGASPRRYWTPPTQSPLEGPVEQQLAAVRETFFDAVRIRLRSDVPVGVLVSGGIDSSAVAVAMRRALGRDADLHMLSAVTADARYDEQPFLDQLAAHVGCEPHRLVVDRLPEKGLGLLEQLAGVNGEPLGAFSDVARYLLMQEAQQLGVTVVLSGQGADELLCGYSKYLGFYLQSLINQRAWTDALRVLQGFVRRKTVLWQFDVSEAKRYLPAALRLGEVDISGPVLREGEHQVALGLGTEGFVARQLADVDRFSLPALVHREDRLSMACSREMRFPFLDYRLVSLLLPLEADWKLRAGWTKWVFRKAMEADLPPAITWRRDKQGFENPQQVWLRRELRPQVQAVLRSPLLIADAGLVSQPALCQRYTRYCWRGPVGAALSYKDIFNPLALEFWARRFEPYLQLTA